MALQLGPVPSFQTNIPQPPDPLQKYGEMIQLRELLGRQALQPLQMQAEQQRIQAQQLQNQASQIDLNAKQAYNAYWSNPDQYQSDELPHRDALAGMLGISIDDPLMTTMAGQRAAGVPMDHVIAEGMHTLQFRQEATKATKEHQEVLKNAFDGTREIAAPILAEKDATRKQALLDQAREGLAVWAQFIPGAAAVIPQLHAGNFDAYANRIGAEEKAYDVAKKAAEATGATPAGKGAIAGAEAQGRLDVESSPQALKLARQKSAIEVGQAVATEVGKAKALAPQLSQITRSTQLGRKYISAEDLTGESGNLVRQQAAAAGIPVVDKETTGTLEDIDTARSNQQYMLNVIGSKLAKDPTKRLYTAPANTIEKLAQSDPELAAVGTFRNAAIQSMRAVAGSKGLRINQYEVQLAIDNDIPKMTDTLPVAQAKLRNLQAFLGNAEQSHLERNRSGAATLSPAAQALIQKYSGGQ